MATSEYPTRPSWTVEQAKVMHGLRQNFAGILGRWPPSFAPPSTAGDLLQTKIEGLPEGVHVKAVSADPADGLPDALLAGPIAPAPVALFVFSATPEDQLPSPPETRVVVWFHGGGNVLRSPIDKENLQLISSLALGIGAGSIVVAPAYRTATVPNQRFPANLQDFYSTYVHLLRQGYSPDNMVVGGESAGGNSALLLAYILAQVQAPPPSKLVAIGPAADHTYNYSEYALAQQDVDLFSRDLNRAFTAQWLGQPPARDPADPFVSAAFIPTIPESWPTRTLILSGGADMLVDGGRIVTKKLKEAGKDVEYVEVADMPHAFWAFPIFIKQKEETWERVYKFIRT